MNRRCRLVLLVAVVLTSACANSPKSAEDVGGETLGGRMSVRVDALVGAPAQSVSAAFELRGDAGRGRLDLRTPLGNVFAQARWAPGSVLLVTPQGDTRFDDLDALTRAVLGESLPIAALFDWLRGRPWPGAASTPSVAPAEPGFAQLGWVVNLAHFDEAQVGARRERAPVVTVRAILDQR